MRAIDQTPRHLSIILILPVEQEITHLATIEHPEEVVRIELPDATEARLQTLLDKQDVGEVFSSAQREEAEGHEELAEFLTFFRLIDHRNQV